jgi:hypothetical protein
MAQPPNPAFNKFNSLDRRALARRNNANSNGLLKLVAPPTGPESLPVVVGSQQQPIGNIIGRLTSSVLNQFDNNRLNKEPERRHSSYDAATSRTGYTSTSVSRISSRTSAGPATGPSAININGLPDPFGTGLRPINHSGTGSVYSSQESLHRGTTPLRPTSTTSTASTATTRPGAGTPQFQNLSGLVRTSANGLIPPTTVNNSRTTLSSLYHRDQNNAPIIGSTVINTNIGGSASSSSTSSGGAQDMNQTPSPSDSAVGDMETILKEKDTEINYLRETMEQNEQVIFKVSQISLLTARREKNHCRL